MKTRFLLESHRTPELNGEFNPSLPTCLDDAGHPYFGRILHHLNRLLGETDLSFVVTTSNVETLPEYGPGVISCILEDEQSKETFYRSKVGAIFRCYPTFPSHLDGVHGFKPIHRLGASYVVARDFLRGAPGRLRTLQAKVGRQKIAPIFEIPIGYHAHDTVDFIPFEMREWDAFFCGSISHLRKNSPDEILAKFRPKSLERLQMKAAIEQTLEEHPEVRIDRSYTASFNESIASSQQSYLEKMMNSRFSLAPRGGVPHTYRFFEALRYGTIPIGETFPKSVEGAPFVRLRQWDDLSETLSHLLEDRARLKELHENALTWWETQEAEEVVARRMFSQLCEMGMAVEKTEVISAKQVA
ncbi:MAG: hypothetical protein CMO55_02495 [Verrucomicrobiales bacterium]|nr:hypothetical protein [Verrucomicrobiales bacterium]